MTYNIIFFDYRVLIVSIARLDKWHDTAGAEDCCMDEGCGERAFEGRTCGC